jgi:Type I phosphodiesterase / nucleotide pyrophosphatase
MKLQSVISLVGLLCLATCAFPAHARPEQERTPIRRVLLLSVDGFHAIDLQNYVKSTPTSTLAQLSKIGVTYPKASTSKPSDSFPGLLSMVTGGSPISTGVYYDVSYDRKLFAPGSNCTGTPGTVPTYDETIDFNLDLLDGGGGIDPTKLPRDGSKGCAPVYPHSFLRVNTIFEVVKGYGKRTAWSDKHPAYDLVNGPSGSGVDDLYTPEINASKTATGVPLYPNGDIGTATTGNAETYDDFKVKAIVNEINGLDSSGTKRVRVPALFGMNFQAVSVAQKAVQGGYTDGQATPSDQLKNALDHTDQSIGQMVEALSRRGLLSSTLIIVTAKHGQSPIDKNTLKTIGNGVTSAPSTLLGNLVAQGTEDDISLLWLTDQGQTAAAVQTLSNNQTSLSLQQIYSGETLKKLFGDPLQDSRTPDIIVQPTPGVIYTKSTKKIAEHGGFAPDDTNVALLLSSSALKPGKIQAPVETTQIAPTILQALGIPPATLEAVRTEKTSILPGLTTRPEIRTEEGSD